MAHLLLVSNFGTISVITGLMSESHGLCTGNTFVSTDLRLGVCLRILFDISDDIPVGIWLKITWVFAEVWSHRFTFWVSGLHSVGITLDICVLQIVDRQPSCFGHTF